MPAPATVGKYTVKRLIKHGGMGSLYLAFDPDLKRSVAIKLLRGDLDHDELRKRFERETAAVAGLRHRNIVTIFDTGIHEGDPYLVMDYIPGETLAELIRRQAHLSVQRKLQIVEDICAALGHAHASGIVHRDVKPANVMIDDDDTVKVVDFGIARIRDSDLTDGAVIGTLSYMAPEQMSGGHVDHRVDVFAVGAVMYELLSFRRAFQGGIEDGLIAKVMNADPPPLATFCPDLPLEVCAIAARAMDKDPDRRYQDVRALRGALAAARQRYERTHEEVVGPMSPDPTVLVPPRRDAPPTESRQRSAAAVLNTEIDAQLDTARQAMTTGEFERATRICQEVLAADPDNAEARDVMVRVADRESVRRPPTPTGSRAVRQIFSSAALAVVGLILAGVTLWVGPGRKPEGALEDRRKPPDVTVVTTPKAVPPPSEAVPVPSPLPPPPRAVAGGAQLSPGPVSISTPSTGTGANAPSTVGTPGPDPVAVRPAPVSESQKPEDKTPPAPDPLLAPPVTAVPTPPPTSLPTPPPEAAPPRPSDRQPILDVLSRLTAAMTARNMTDVAAVVQMEAGVARQLQNNFNQIRSWRVTFAGASVKVEPDGLSADVTYTLRFEEVEYLARPGRKERSDVLTHDRMRNVEGRWRIVR